MDQILSSLLLSDQTDAVKRQVIQKIAVAGPRAEDATIVKSMFKTTTDFILDAEEQFAADLCKKVYVKWAKYHGRALHEFFNTDFTQHLLDSKFKHPANAVWLLHETFLLLRGTEHHAHLVKIVEAKSVGFVRDHPKDDVLTALCKFLFEFKECIPKGEHTSTFCVAVVHAVSAFSAPTDPTGMPQFICNVTGAIGTFIRHIWHNSAPECVMHCLKAIFTLISYVDQTGAEPCIALGGLVTHVPPELIEKVVKMTVADASIADANMVAALLRVIDWLNWPVATNIDQWILAFLRELALAHKYTILIKVTEVKIEQVYTKLHYPIVRERGMAVVSHMLLSFQHSPEAFHKIVHQVPATVAVIRSEAGPESAAFLDRFSELLHCLISLHPGFPELYDKVIDAIKDYHKPSAEVIRLRLNQNKWSFQHKHSDMVGFATRFAKKSETGKTGLTNLGNTCYMNSVLQALFMCDGFRHEILRAPISPQQGLLVKLQLVMAHLAMTQRAAYSPVAFLKASRPPWFTAGHQQDCSEFLRYLLDQLHEQELNVLRARKRMSNSTRDSSQTSPKRTKNSLTGAADRAGGDEQSILREETLIRRTYGGQMCTTYRCLRCGKASSRTEDFTDIPLAFPNQDQQPTGKAALAGGAMSVSPSSTGRPVERGVGNNGAGGSQEALPLETMLEYYLKPELLQGDNCYQCDSCGGLQEAERTQHVAHAPEYLILTLLRFAYDARTQSRSKIFTDVTCPRTIKLPVTPNGAASNTRYAASPKAGRSTFFVPSSGVEHETYGLYSVVVHSGTSSECGHYYCYGRHSQPVAPLKNGDGGRVESGVVEDHLADQWYLFNDSRVTFTSYSAFSNVSKKFAKDTIYLLMYKRIMQGKPMTDVVEPSLRKDLREAVEQDNKLFIQEQELEGRARAMQKASANAAAASSWYNQWKDDDGNGGPPGSCGGGGGGGGGLDISGSRFIF